MKNFNTKLLDNFMKEKHLTKNQFCQACKISLNTLKRIYDQKENFRITTLRKIRSFTNIKSDKFLNLQ